MAEESAMSTAESGVSGMSSASGVDPAAPVPGGAGAAQAEMITKKLANYWCIIGSIPLVMFLLVALPTIFYVKKFSEYVNADYCDTKSCKELADLIQKMGDTSDACKGFSAHVCKAKTDFFTKTAEKIFLDTSAITVDASMKGVGKATDAKNLLGNYAPLPEPPDQVDLQLQDGYGANMDYDGNQDPEGLAAAMAINGIDGFVRAVHVIGNTSGNQGSMSMLELSAPIEDMYPYVVLDMMGIDLKAAVLAMEGNSDDGDKLGKLGDFITSFNVLVTSNTLNSRQHMSKLMKVSEMKSIPVTGWSWEKFFEPFQKLSLDYVTDDSLVRLSHPKYLLALDKFMADWEKKDPNFRVVANGMMTAIARLNVLGHSNFAKFPGNAKAAAVMLVSRIYPAALDHLLFHKRSKQFGAATGVNPGGANDTQMMDFLSQEVQGMLDSMTFSYALSEKATEENRVHFYRRVKSMKVAPGFFNDSGGLSDTDITSWVSQIDASGDNGPDPVAAPIQSRLNFPTLYWQSKNMTFLKFRNAYSPLYATYTPTENHLFVPMGVFTPPVFRNSQKNRIFAATSGYLVMAGVMKALTMSGSMIVDGQLMGENWVGYSWSRKMEKYALCLSTDRKDNSSIMAAMDIPFLAAVIPAYRYFKRMVLEKAFPRPEFRIDWLSDISSTQLFFYKWALLHCGTATGKEIIDLSAKNSRYFHEAFKCDATSKMYKAVPCDLWNTTRRDY